MTKKKLAFLALSSTLLVLLLSAAVFGQVSPKESVYRYLSIFTEVFSLVRSNYVDTVPQEQLIDGAFTGVTDAIDEFSYYVPPAQMAQFRAYKEDELNRIGLVVSKRFGYAYVVAPIEGSPADKAGLRTGDFIERINGKSTGSMAVWQIRDALAAATPDKPLQLTVLHNGMAKREQIQITPAPFEAPLPSRVDHGDVARIVVPFFGTGTAAKLEQLLAEVRSAGVRKLIVDLRGNAGGSLQEAVQSADLFLRSGTITTLIGKRAENQKFTADEKTAYDGDLQVLIDQSSAAGAEIFAAAISGNERGKTIGVATYGKAVDQKLIALPSGGSLFMTIGHYTAPDGKAIKEQGVRPDVVVDLTPNFIAASEKRPEEDLILQKALALYGVAVEAERAAA